MVLVMTAVKGEVKLMVREEKEVVEGLRSG
jgi:hypothetical protein